MLVFRGVPTLATTSTVLTIGNFDGVHLGHQAVISQAAAAGAPLGIGALLKAANLVPSTSEAGRMVDQGGVRVDGAVVSDKGLKLSAGTFVVQVGKRKFARVTLA